MYAMYQSEFEFGGKVVGEMLMAQSQDSLGKDNK